VNSCLIRKVLFFDPSYKFDTTKIFKNQNKWSGDAICRSPSWVREVAFFAIPYVNEEGKTSDELICLVDMLWVRDAYRMCKRSIQDLVGMLAKSGGINVICGIGQENEHKISGLASIALDMCVTWECHGREIRSQGPVGKVKRRSCRIQALKLFPMDVTTKISDSYPMEPEVLTKGSLLARGIFAVIIWYYVQLPDFFSFLRFNLFILNRRVFR